MYALIKNNQGQGLIELIIAIGVITVGLFAVWGLFISNYTSEREAAARLIGVNFAREGIEVVRNIRDSNWLLETENLSCSYPGYSNTSDPCPWYAGILTGDGTATVNNLQSDSEATGPDAATALNLDFSSNAITDDTTLISASTSYRRLITLRAICCADSDRNGKCDAAQVQAPRIPGDQCANDELVAGVDATVQVSWMSNGATRQSIVSEQLFNWK